MKVLTSTRRLAVLMAVLAVSLSAYGGDGKIHRVGKKIPNSYIVMLYLLLPRSDAHRGAHGV